MVMMRRINKINANIITTFKVSNFLKSTETFNNKLENVGDIIYVYDDEKFGLVS